MTSKNRSRYSGVPVPGPLRAYHYWASMILVLVGLLELGGGGHLPRIERLKTPLGSMQSVSNQDLVHS
jgi:hypothetical protein